MRIPADLRGCSVGELLTVEKMTDRFARHGFPIETEAAVRLSPIESRPECYMDEDRMLFCLLNGVFIHMSASDKTLKEKRVWVTPALDSLCWQTRSSSQIHRLAVRSIREEVPISGIPSVVAAGDRAVRAVLPAASALPMGPRAGARRTTRTTW